MNYSAKTLLLNLNEQGVCWSWFRCCRFRFAIAPQIRGKYCKLETEMSFSFMSLAYEVAEAEKGPDGRF